jgi:hypothetical protein
LKLLQAAWFIYVAVALMIERKLDKLHESLKLLKLLTYLPRVGVAL